MKAANTKNAIPVKVLLPQTISALKKTCQTALKESEPILTITNEDGTIITHINQITPESVISASTKKITPKSPTKIVDLNLSVADIRSIPTMIGAAGSTVAERHINSPARRSPMSPTRMNQDDVTSQATRETTGFSTRCSKSMASRATEAIFNEKLMGKSTISRKGIVKQNRYNSFRATVEQLLPETNKPFFDLEYLLENEFDNPFINNSFVLEEQQMRLWHHNVMKQPFINNLSKKEPFEEFIKTATSVLEEHRFVSGRVNDHCMKVGIIGPVGSGKSSLLKEIVNQYTCELTRTGHWKSTFVYALDVKAILEIIDDYPKLIRYFIELGTDLVASQNPSILTELEPAKRQLLSITKNKVIYNPNNVTRLTNLAVLLSSCLYDEDGFLTFYTNVFLIPMLIAQEFGYEEFFFIVDNIDMADIQLKPHAPFDTDGDFLFVVEYIKHALTYGNYAIACHDTSDFYQTMGPTDEKGIDLINGMNIVTNTDIAIIDEDDNGVNVKVDICNEEEPIYINASLCGGVVTYLNLWDSLIETLSTMNAEQQGYEAYERTKDQAIGIAQDLVEYIYFSNEVEELKVSDVKKIN